MRALLILFLFTGATLVHAAGGDEDALRALQQALGMPQPPQAIPEDKQKGSLDPLSAALSVGLKGDAACEQTAPSNDGKRRIDVLLKKVGTETPSQAGVPQAKGDLLVCDVLQSLSLNCQLG